MNMHTIPAAAPMPAPLLSLSRYRTGCPVNLEVGEAIEAHAQALERLANVPTADNDIIARHAFMSVFLAAPMNAAESARWLQYLEAAPVAYWLRPDLDAIAETLRGARRRHARNIVDFAFEA